MIEIYETWIKGVMTNRTIYGDDQEEKVIKTAINMILVDLQTIQEVTLTTEIAQITAIKKLAETLEKLIRFLKERYF